MVLQPYNARQRRTRNVSNVENRKPAVAAPTQPYPKRKRAGRVPGSIRNLHDNKRRVSTANKLLISAAASRAGSIGQTPEFVPMEVDMTTIPSPFTAGNITLPRHLAHPLVKTPRPECLRAQGIDPNVDLLYTRNIFRTVGPKMWRTLTSMSISTVAKQRGLPRAVDLTVNDCSGEIPTHCLAVWPLDRQQGQQDLEKALPVTLYPVHGSVLAINAAHLPVLPAGTPAAPRTRGSRMQVPVVSLAVPAPNAFNPLLRYMYTKDHNALFASFFPDGTIPSVATTPREQVLAGAETLARMVPRSVLFRIASGLTGLWRNTCFLGVFDDALWATMDLAWEVTLSALAMSAPEPIPFA